MLRWLFNIVLLSRKELRSLLRDRILMGLIVFCFTAAVVLIANGLRAEVYNASVAIIDSDRTELSRRIRDAIQPPYFQPPADIAREQSGAALDRGRFIFIIDIPPGFEADVLAGRTPSIHILVDATAITLAGLGTSYLHDIILTEVLGFLHAGTPSSALPFRYTSRIVYNPNFESYSFTSVMQVVTNITILSIILVGAAVIRERERGTIEHLLVMPVRTSEIAIAKIGVNGAVILAAALLSLGLVVHMYLGVPLGGSIPLFVLGAVLYLFSVTSLGMCLATFAPSMPQFGLLVVPVYMIFYLLSGSASPVESMPPWLQAAAYLLPSTQFVSFTQAILYREAGITAVWQQLVIIGLTGSLYWGLALARFRQMLARQV